MTTQRCSLFVTAILLACAVPASASHAAAVCEVRSGAATAALVELYTSEGCSSCPPADRQLRALRASLPAGAVVVPIGLHVSYWDSLGWRDPFAQAGFDARQRALLDHRRATTAYTPQFFVNGDELRGWHTSLGDAIRQTNARPAAASISLRSAAGDDAGGTLRLDVQASVSKPQAGDGLYVAVTESGLQTKVGRGENGGVTLRHDDTARVLLGPIAFVNGQAALHRALALPPAWRRGGLRAVAFVQQGNGPVLQAVDTAACAAPIDQAGGMP